MDQAAIINELRGIEAEAYAYMCGLQSLRERSYSLRKKLEGVNPPVSPKGQAKREKAAVDSAVRFKRKMAKKLTK